MKRIEKKRILNILWASMKEKCAFVKCVSLLLELVLVEYAIIIRVYV